MTDIDYQVRIEKDGTLRVVDPASNATLADVPFRGDIMKGCSKDIVAQVMDLNQPGVQRLMQSFATKFSHGHFSLSNFKGVLSMVQNPKIKDSGYEIQLVPGQEYPKKQVWSMYGIFTADLSNVDPAFSRLQLANRQESPVRLEVTLDGPWGDKPLRYVMMDDEVPLYPWDTSKFDFADTCPIHGTSPAKPIAYIRKDGDKTQMTNAWRMVSGVLTKTI
jgi:hypothetical protein